MSWLRIAADLFRDAMGSSTAPQESTPDLPPPADIAGVIDLMNRHRFEIDRNFQAVAEMLNAQKQRQLKARQIQRRWNYGLLAGLVILAILAIVSFWRS
jgi:hypothetical protein